MNRNWKWWTLDIIHNIVIHPFLPLADVLEHCGLKRVANLVYWLHDHTAPVGGG